MLELTKTLRLPLPELAEQFLLDPTITFLNHGSFGACPHSTFETYQRWQRDLESQPVNFIMRRLPDLLAAARTRLAEFIGTTGENVSYVPNVTYALNIVARSIKLAPGDEVLGTDHEYGATSKTWQFVCEQQGATYIEQPIPLPVTTPEAFVEQLWQGVTERTKVIAISHITSPTALIFPVQMVCQRARAEGIITVIDGAHALGQVDLDMATIGADFYGGNCHKWLCAPKGSGFLYTSPEQHDVIEPLVVSHGWRAEEGYMGVDNSFLSNLVWTGTDDPASYLTVPTAIEFHQAHDWPQVRAACHQLARDTLVRIHELSKMPYLCPLPSVDNGSDDYRWWSQLVAVHVPMDHLTEIQQRLWHEFQIEIPVFAWKEYAIVRISIQAYNKPADADRLVAALAEIMV